MLLLVAIPTQNNQVLFINVEYVSVIKVVNLKRESRTALRALIAGLF